MTYKKSRICDELNMTLHYSGSGQYKCSVQTKVKLPLFIIKHYFINTYGGVEARRSTYFVILAQGEASGQLDTSAALPSEEEPIWALWEIKNLLPLRLIEPQFFRLPTHSLSTLPTELSRLHKSSVLFIFFL
jgi:hypothetical protein